MLDEGHFHRLGKALALERHEEVARLAALRQETSPAGQEALGLCWLDVELSAERGGLGGRSLCTLSRAQPLLARPSPGDVVRVSPRKAEADDAPTGTVVKATRAALEVAFDRPPPEWLRAGRLKVELTVSDVTARRVEGALAQVAGEETAPSLRERAQARRELLLLRRGPRFEAAPPADVGPALNPEQRLAVQRILQSREVVLVHGPPGTGKSTVLGQAAVALARRGERLLCTAASNAAVDHLLEVCLEAGLSGVRVGHPARVLPHLVQHTLDERAAAHPDYQVARGLYDEAHELFGYARRQRTQGRTGARFGNARQAQAEGRRLLDEARALERRATAHALQGAQVVASTLAMLDGAALAGQRFDVALVDEATQAVEPLTLLAWLKAPRLVLAGDSQQLPPTVLSLEAARLGLDVSLFQRWREAWGEEAAVLLKEQHRMHPLLMAFPSAELYGGQLRAHPATEGRTLAALVGQAVDAPPLLFLDTAGKGFEEESVEGAASLENPGEAALVEARARELMAAGLPARELAVITPYLAQARRLAQALEDVEGLEVDTVDAFQGREKEAVLLSLVRSNPTQALGFLADHRRTNVALTRARRHAFVVGDSATLSGDGFYARLVETAQAQGGYRSAWEWPTEG